MHSLLLYLCDLLQDLYYTSAAVLSSRMVLTQSRTQSASYAGQSCTVKQSDARTCVCVLTDWLHAACYSFCIQSQALTAKLT